MHTFQSFSSAETKSFGRAFAAELVKQKVSSRATVLALRGELGSGKTTFVQGLFRGLRLNTHAKSPTFVLMRRVPLKRPPFTSLFHIDAYRLRSSGDLIALGLKAILDNPRNLLIVEWADRVKGIVPKGTVWVTFHHGRRADERKIMVRK